MLVAGFPLAPLSPTAARSPSSPSCLLSLPRLGPSAFSADTVPAQAPASLSVILLLLPPLFFNPLSVAEWLQRFQPSLAGFPAEPAEVLAFAGIGPFLCRLLGREDAMLWLSWVLWTDGWGWGWGWRGMGRPSLAESREPWSEGWGPFLLASVHVNQMPWVGQGSAVSTAAPRWVCGLPEGWSAVLWMACPGSPMQGCKRQDLHHPSPTALMTHPLSVVNASVLFAVVAVTNDHKFSGLKHVYSL